MGKSTLLRHTYPDFPYYAINSSKVPGVVPGKQVDRVEKEIPNREESRLFTIGKEGISLDRELENSFATMGNP